MRSVPVRHVPSQIRGCAPGKKATCTRSNSTYAEPIRCDESKQRCRQLSVTKVAPQANPQVWLPLGRLVLQNECRRSIQDWQKVAYTDSAPLA